jgi:hypothetical protein
MEPANRSATYAHSLHTRYLTAKPRPQFAQAVVELLDSAQTEDDAHSSMYSDMDTDDDDIRVDAHDDLAPLTYNYDPEENFTHLLLDDDSDPDERPTHPTIGDDTAGNIRTSHDIADAFTEDGLINTTKFLQGAINDVQHAPTRRDEDTPVPSAADGHDESEREHAHATPAQDLERDTIRLDAPAVDNDDHREDDYEGIRPGQS